MKRAIRFLHTADWQLGKPFGGVQNEAARLDLQRVRFDAIAKIGDLVRQEALSFVVVAGDLFDSVAPDPRTVARCCGEIGRIPVPFYVIGGNHDYAGAGSVWESEVFRRQRDLSPNLHVLSDRKAVVTETAVIFPCSLLRRHEVQDPTGWLRDGIGDVPDNLPRIVIAHGTIQGFGSFPDDEECSGETPNFLDLERLPMEAFDYVALGDWHGTREVSPKAWYSGTPEPDRFSKGSGNDPGNVLLVEVERGVSPKIQKCRTAAVGWHDLDWEFTNDNGVNLLRRRLEEMLGQRVGLDILRLELRGALGFEEKANLDRLVADWDARLIRLRLDDSVRMAPTEAELEALTHRSGDPLIASVARQLMAMCSGAGGNSRVAAQALRELYLAALGTGGNTP